VFLNATYQNGFDMKDFNKLEPGMTVRSLTTIYGARVMGQIIKVIKIGPLNGVKGLWYKDENNQNTCSTEPGSWELAQRRVLPDWF
jgi:hypothetical protein